MPGAKVTTIQALLGHVRLNTTMTHARVHDQTIMDDYFRAMEQIEEVQTAVFQPKPVMEKVNALLDKLGQDELNDEQQQINKIASVFATTFSEPPMPKWDSDSISLPLVSTNFAEEPRVHHRENFYAFSWTNRDLAASMRSLTPLFPSIKPNKTNVIIAPIKIIPTT